MHFPKLQVSLLLGKIKKVLKPGGILFFSVSISRDDIDDSGFDKKGRFFLQMDANEWVSLCEKHGFTKIDLTGSDDGLGRGDISWLTCVFKV